MGHSSLLSSSPTQTQPPYGRRLVPQVLDDTAAAEPDRPFVLMPRSGKPEDGWKPVTYRQVTSAINHVAHQLRALVGEPPEGTFPTIAYVGPNDIAYLIMLAACVKAHCKALFVSPRNSLEGQLSLFAAVECDLLVWGGIFGPSAETWTQHRPSMRALQLEGAEVLLQSSGPSFPYTRTFDEARFEPLVVLHTSGSTGHPKPVVVRHGSVAIDDTYRQGFDIKSSRKQSRQWHSDAWATKSKALLLDMPQFHTAGIGVLLSHAVWRGSVLVLPIADRPSNPQLLVDTLCHSGADAVLTVPSLIEELNHSEESVAVLKKLNFVAFAGGTLSTSAGDSLVEKGVFLNNRIASTEIYPYPMSWQEDTKLWRWFVFNEEEMGAEWVPHGEGVYELVVRRKNPDDPMDQQIFYTFPDLTEWSTKDLYKKHPTLPEHWIYHGRIDNIIVFSNGEKLNPIAIEEGLAGHPDIKGAVVVGAGRFQAALLLEPAVPTSDPAAAGALIDKVWPLVEKLNKETVAHGRISRDLIRLSKPELPFVRAGKGTVIRVQTIKAYQDVVEDMYRQAAEGTASPLLPVFPLELGSVDDLATSFVRLFETATGVRQMGPDTDFFQVGIDSLQIINAHKLLVLSLEAAGVVAGSETVNTRAIYANPTPRRLATYLDTVIQGNKATVTEYADREIQAAKDLVSKYTRDLPAPPQTPKPEPQDDQQTVLVVGTTGSHGGYLLHQLISSSRVQRIIALNRGADGGRAAQESNNASRGLTTDFSKVVFLHADLSQPDLGLGKSDYDALLPAVDRIIHNAWPVNFNISVASFEPSIRGVRHLVDLAAAATKRVPIIFVSTISTVEGWSEPGPVPEEPMPDLSLARMGYGRSKLAASLILDAAASTSQIPTASVRVGQIAGPKTKQGVWNKREYIPALVASSLFLGLLPERPGKHDGDTAWIPVEDVASIVLDIAGVTAATAPPGEIRGYFNCANPHAFRWSELVAVLREVYAGRIERVVSMGEWIAALERSARTMSEEDIAKNPAVKLVDSYKIMLEGDGTPVLDVTRTKSRSPTIRQLGPVTADLVRNWCEQWGY